MADLRIPKDAFFRRAEGTHTLIDLCAGTSSFHVMASRQGPRTESDVSAQEAEAIGRLSQWQTAAESGLPFELLRSLVQRDCLFWSTTRPRRVLTGEVISPLEGKVALRRNVQSRVLVTTGEGVRDLWHMPRRGDLDQAAFGGVTFAAREMLKEVAWVTVRCCQRHARMVRELLPLLDGGHDVSELTLQRGERGERGERGDRAERAFVEAMGRLGWLERHTPPPAWNGQAQVTWLAHAGVLYEARGKRILVDPLSFHESIPSRYDARPFDVRDLGKIDAVLLTHGDHDHLNPSTLIRLRSDVPIVIPATTKAEPYQVDMFQLLTVLGCRRIVEMREWDELDLGEVRVVAAPFAGEDWGLTLPCRTYLVTSPDLTIFCNADSTSTPAVYEKIKSKYRVDVAFVGVTGAAETYAMPPGYGYGDFYVAHIPPERHNEWVQLCNGPQEAAVAARELGARYAVGYAAGGAPYCEIAYSDRGTHADLAKILRETGGPEPLEMTPGIAVTLPAR
jgi:L-ascorbate metabolism protein UlaG (beta-lactamase superfamily)